MEQFPGRFLEEIDQIDANRVLRARAAKRYEAAEARNRLVKAGKLKAGDLMKDEWDLILEMDALERELDD